MKCTNCNMILESGLLSLNFVKNNRYACPDCGHTQSGQVWEEQIAFDKVVLEEGDCIPLWIKKLRKHMSLLQSEIANDMNVSVSSISLYENGKRKTDIETLFEIAKSIGYKVEIVLTKEQQ